MLLGPAGVRYQVVLVVCRHQVLQDRPRLEDLKLQAVGRHVGDGRDASIGVDLGKPPLLVLILEDINLHQLCDVSGSPLNREGRKKLSQPYLVLEPKLL